MTTEKYIPSQELAGSEVPHFASCNVGGSVTCDRLTPLGLVTATGLVALWDPDATNGSEKAVYLSAYGIDTTAGQAKHKVIKSGHWNSDAIKWPEGVTDLQKSIAFVGTPLSHEAI